MSRLRFETAREVYDAFPGLYDDVKAPPTGEHPIAFVRALAGSDTPEDALTFSAFALSRREAVWWGCQCVRAVAMVGPGQEDLCLRAAEDWVRDPEEARRINALKLGTDNDGRAATPWLALGAGWSGGNISAIEGGYAASKPEMTAKAVRTAILVALARVGAKERAPKLSTCVDGALKLMGHDAAGMR